MHRADPRVFLVAESAAGPLPEMRVRSVFFVQGDPRAVLLRSEDRGGALQIGKNAGAEPKR